MRPPLTSESPSIATTPSHAPIVERLITGVQRAEDGWGVEVEDVQGHRLWYWIADASGCVLAMGGVARFIGGAFGQPIRGIELNGCQVS